MTVLRHDLLELTPEALTALANAGFVKRAQKDVAAGLLPKLALDSEGVVQADFDDGVRTTLPPGRTLRDAQCNCPASGMCRHRVMLVLAYQAQASAGTDTAAPADVPAPSGEPSISAQSWSPADFDDAALAASLAPLALEQAAKLAAERPLVGVQAGRDGTPPAARLPMCSVRFFSRTSLAHARCDCKQGSGCAHVVLAVWAFRQAAPAQNSGTAEIMVEVQPPADTAASERAALFDGEAARTLCAQIDALLLTLWLDGSSQPLMALAARIETAREQARTLGWRWVEDAIDELWQLLQAQQARSSRFEPLRLLHVLAELWARLRAAAHAERQPQPVLRASQILGLGLKGEVALDHLRLVSLGAQLWSDEAAEGASVLFADPDTQTVTVLERQWPRTTEAGGPTGTATPLLNRRIAGFPLRQLASGQVITKVATRRANGLIDIGTGVRQTGVLPLSPKSWDDLAPPLRQPSVAALVAQLRKAPPDFVRPRQAANGASAGASGTLHVLAFEGMQVQSCHWDAAAQVLHARLNANPSGNDDPGAGSDGDSLFLALPHRAAAPGAVDALAHALAGEWGALRAVAGTVRLQMGRAVMQPLALLTAQNAVVLQVATAAPQPLAVQSEPEDTPALALLMQETQEMLASWLRQGLRHQSHGTWSRAEAQITRLESAGLTQSARLMRAVRESLHSAQCAGLMASMVKLSLLMQGVHGEGA